MFESERPQMMKALLLEQYHGVAGLSLAERPVPQPGPGEVLVRMLAAPVNPADLLFMHGVYAYTKPLPAPVGLEGCGVVVEAGPGLYGRALKGLRVAVGAQGDQAGTWAEYTLAQAGQVIPLRKGIPTEQGAMLIVNPLAAFGLLDTARRYGQRGFIQTAAASALGQMLLKMGMAQGHPVINVVRRHAQVELLHAQGAEHVLNSHDPDFFEKLSELSRRLNVRLAFDAVGGSLTAKLLAAMPRGAEVIVYGALEAAPLNLDPRAFVFQDKRVSGFYLTDWIGAQPLPRFLRQVARLQKLIEAGSIYTEIAERVPLEDAIEGMQGREGKPSQGKMLILIGR